MARIFICGDTAQGDLLDAASEALAGQGNVVVRGPPNTVGVVKRYDVAERKALIDEADVAVFTTRHICSRELMLSATRLRGICFPVTGVETLDIAAANDLGIIVGHGAVRGNIIGMAEATAMLVLMLLYEVQDTMRRFEAGLWRRAVPVGHQAEGKTLGLIGFGRIAREVALRLASFGMRILTTSPRTSKTSLPDGVSKVDLERLMRDSDVVCVLTGLTAETAGMIGPDQLDWMKRSAYLINTSRGGVINEAALCERLLHRRIAGAALDTFSAEPVPPDSPLRSLDNVILTPHGVGHTVEGNAEFLPTLIENVCRILRHELPLHCKNPEAEAAWRERLSTIGTARGAA